MSQGCRWFIHSLSQQIFTERLPCAPQCFIHGARLQAPGPASLASWGWFDTAGFYIVSLFHFLNTSIFYSWSQLQPSLSIPLDGEEVMPCLFHFSRWCLWVGLDTTAQTHSGQPGGALSSRGPHPHGSLAVFTLNN